MTRVAAWQDAKKARMPKWWKVVSGIAVAKSLVRLLRLLVARKRQKRAIRDTYGMFE